MKKSIVNMSSNQNGNSIKKIFLSAVFLTVGFIASIAQESDKATPIGTTAVLGTLGGITIEGMVQSPSETDVPLQIACVFEDPTGNDIYTSPPALPAAVNGVVHLDKALKGLITDLRKNGKFAGHAFETLLITPAPGTIPAKKLLLIGRGDRNLFNEGVNISVARVAMREALRLNVSTFAYASDIVDGGVDYPKELMGADAYTGFFEAYKTQQYLNEKNMGQYSTLKKIIILDGPAFAATSWKGTKKIIAELNK